MIKQLSTPISADLTISDAIREFTLHQRTSRHSPQTARFYDYTLGKAQRWLEGKGIERVSEFTAPVIREYLCELQEANLSANTVHGHMRALRAVFCFLVREELILKSPMAKVTMPRLDKKILPAFTESEIEALMKATEGREFRDVRNRLLVMLLIDSGLRLAECASLRLDSIDPQTGVMKVLGKGRKERLTRIGAKTQRVLHKYLRLRGGSGSDPLWIGKRGPMTQAGIAETLEKLGNRAKVHAHPHKFRRTCALMLLRNGADVFTVQHLMGHADLTVLRRYLAQTDQDILAAHERFSPMTG